LTRLLEDLLPRPVLQRQQELGALVPVDDCEAVLVDQVLQESPWVIRAITEALASNPLGPEPEPFR